MPQITFDKAEEKEIKNVSGKQVKLTFISSAENDCTCFEVLYKVSSSVSKSMPIKLAIAPNKNRIAIETYAIKVSDVSELTMSVKRRDNKEFKGTVTIEYEVISIQNNTR